jgi:hypothetical protein
VNPDEQAERQQSNDESFHPVFPLVRQTERVSKTDTPRTSESRAVSDSFENLDPRDATRRPSSDAGLPNPHSRSFLLAVR